MAAIIEEINYFPKSGYFAHCVPMDFDNPKSWSKGIAAKFVQEFKGVKRYCNEYVKKWDLKEGDIITYCINEENKILFNVFTKRHYYNKPTIDNFKDGIYNLSKRCMLSGVTELYMPRLGCGYDGFTWNIVKPIIEESFKDNNIIIKILPDKNKEKL